MGKNENSITTNELCIDCDMEKNCRRNHVGYGVHGVLFVCYDESDVLNVTMNLESFLNLR